MLRQIKGNMQAVEFLDWDSRFFGVKIGRILLNSSTLEELSGALNWADLSGFRCLYWLIDCGDIMSCRTAETNGFHLTDIRLTFEKELCAPRNMSSLDQADVRRYQNHDLTTLLALARRSHRDSRFFSDNGFEEDKSARMYEEWIRRGLSHESGVVWVAEQNGQAVGYCVCQASEHQVGSIGLIAVDPGWRRARVGTALVSTALLHFENEGMRTATVVTQGRNIPSQRLYQRCGFVTKAVQLWYHRWAPKLGVTS